MKFSAGVVAAIAAPMAAMAFIQPSLRSKVATGPAFNINSRSKAMERLQMAFDLKDDQVSNMFEGPTPLVKERDACGVGFIANTNSGGTTKIKHHPSGKSIGILLTRFFLDVYNFYRRIRNPQGLDRGTCGSRLYGTSWCLWRRW